LSKGLATLYAQNEKPGLLEVFTNLREWYSFLRNYSNFCKKIKIVPKKQLFFIEK
jgi:hypothetical protein